MIRRLIESNACSVSVAGSGLRRMLAAFNRQGGFDNLTDTEEGLGEILGASFEHVELETVGSIAIFVAMNPRTDSSG